MSVITTLSFLTHRLPVVALAMLALSVVASDHIELLRTPGGGIEPQAAADGQGTIHLIYFTGEAKAGDLWYVRREAKAAEFSKPIRVNSQSGSALAIGSVRGAHLALGRNGRAHVAWMGSGTAEPKAPDGSTPMLYTHLTDDGAGFEPQRNLIQVATGLDGGGSLAADGKGNVYVAWHAMAGAKSEAGRAVYVTKSNNDGALFAREVPAITQPTGACGCCGMRAFADQAGRVFMLYRGAIDGNGRDMFLLSSSDGKTFTGSDLSPWKLSACPMSTAAIANASERVLLAWQTEDQILFSSIAGKSLKAGAITTAPGQSKGRKHPTIAGNARGETLLAWTEGTGWNQGGSLAWQLYDAAGKPLGATGRADGVPVWGVPTAVARGDDDFTIVY